MSPVADAVPCTLWEQAVGCGPDWIARRIPHAGRMCLLGGVLHASPDQMVCSASNQGDGTHPLRLAGRLGAACGVEYAAQAMALHGALHAELAGQARPQAGFLVSVRDLDLRVPRLDTIPGVLRITVDRLAGSGASCAYGFRLDDERGRPLLSGRAHVLLQDSRGSTAE